MTQQINLLDPSLAPLRDWCNGKFVLGLGVALALGTAGHVAYESRALANFLASTLSAPQDSALASPDASDAPMAELKARVSANQNLLHAVGSFAELPSDNAARLRSLIGAMPDSLWLAEVEFSIERGVRIAGSTLDAKALAGFSDRLGAQPAFRGLPLHLFALQPGESEPVGDARGPDGTPAPVPLRHYGFLLSSIDASRARGGTP